MHLNEAGKGYWMLSQESQQELVQFTDAAYLATAQGGCL